MKLGIKKQQKISTEELAKTQVLNLDDVQKLAKYEKIVSKKPAMYVALVGLFSIIVGLSSQAVVSLTTTNEVSVQPRIALDENVSDNILTCTKTEQEATSMMQINSIYTLNYNGNKLNNYTKEATVTPTDISSVESLTNIQNSMVYYKGLAINVSGYSLVVNSESSGFKLTTTVNTNSIKLNEIVDPYISDTLINPNIDLSMTKDNAKAWFESNSYTCK